MKHRTVLTTPSGTSAADPEPASASLLFPTLHRLLPRPHSLRAQLALWHGSLLAFTLLLLALFTYLLLGTYLNTSADVSLERYARNTAESISSELLFQHAAHPTWPADAARFVGNAGLPSWGRYVQVVDPKGAKVAFSDALRTQSLPVSARTRLQCLAGTSAIFETYSDLGEYPVRMVTVPVRVGRKIPYLVQVGASVEGVETALKRATSILLVLTPSIFVIALIGGWLLVDRALKPVDDMTRLALSLESRRLDVRLVPPRNDDEIGRLAGALNEMIARLDRSFRQVERFSADASHELKTPLTSIRGEAEVALMSGLSSEEYVKTLRSIIEETERMSSIVNNLLLLSRADANQVRLIQEPVELHEIVLTAYEAMERLARRKGVTLDIEAMDTVRVQGDALRLQQLITNLVQNAINITPEGGAVYLALIRGSAEGDRTASDDAVLTVRDTGPGIPSEHLPHLFDRFYRVDLGRSRDQGGSGLGLNIAGWIAESHGGRIGVTSEVGKGATFTVRLPALPPAPVAPDRRQG